MTFRGVISTAIRKLDGTTQRLRALRKPPPAPPSKASAAGPGESTTGRVRHDERGNAVWDIAVSTGVFALESTSKLLKRLEAPELSLFAVDGEPVSVRIGGVMQPLVMARGGQPAAELPRPTAGVHIVETPTLPRPPQAQMPAQPQAAPQAPRPTAGLSLRGRPTGEGAPAPSAPSAPSGASAGGAAPNGPAAAAPASGAAPATPPEKPKDSGDDASARFSLLELD